MLLYGVTLNVGIRHKLHVSGSMAGSMGSVSIDPLTSEFDADVIRPEHLHAIWILPKNDAGFRCAEI